MSNSIEAAAEVIDPLAFAEQGSCPPRGWEHSTPKEVARLLERRKSHALSVAKRIIAAYSDSEIEALRAKVEQWEKTAANAPEYWAALVNDLQAKLADCQAVIRHKGHDADCPTVACSVCGRLQHIGLEMHRFITVGPCSEACGHDRTTGEKA